MSGDGRKKWIPVTKEKVVKTKHWKYILGLYDHMEYGRRCFRVSKFIRENDYFIGHFVVVPQDQNEVLPAIIELIQSLDIEKNRTTDAVEDVDSSLAPPMQSRRSLQLVDSQLTFDGLSDNRP